MTLRKPRRARIKVWRFVLNVEMAYRKDARTNKQLRQDAERFWASFDRLMKSPPNPGIGDDRPDLKNGKPLTYSAAIRSQHRNHVHFDRDES